MKNLRPTQQVRFLIFLVGIATIINIVLAFWLVIKSFRPLNYTVEVNQPPNIDLSFLDFVTNMPTSFQSSSTNLLNRHEINSSLPNTTRLPIHFDSYCEIFGVPYALFKGHAFKVGDFINGQMIESISPWSCVVGGQFYNINKKGLQYDRVPASDITPDSGD